MNASSDRASLDFSTVPGCDLEAALPIRREKGGSAQRQQDVLLLRGAGGGLE